MKVEKLYKIGLFDVGQALSVRVEAMAHHFQDMAVMHSDKAGQ